ncbi:hypothetical protein BaRGS_00011169 [Batillaria attramentaria]|uniref:Transposase n=1 Tax=Batillaria attramentaria TaxID=370345 RepID=A0ABD0LES5_9CAEN
MELEGLKRGLQKICGTVNTSHLITDRHASVKKYMLDRHSKPHHDHQIIHRFDVWHVAKGVGKIIDAASKLKRNATLSLWSKSITKHMHWCSSSSPEGPNRAQLVKDKWVSISDHVADIHEGHGGLFPKCQHDQLVPRAWIKKGEENQ